MEEKRVTTSFKIKSSIRDKFKIYCIQKKKEMSDVIESLIEKLVKDKHNST